MGSTAGAGPGTTAGSGWSGGDRTGSVFAGTATGGVTSGSGLGLGSSSRLAVTTATGSSGWFKATNSAPKNNPPKTIDRITAPTTINFDGLA